MHYVSTVIFLFISQPPWQNWRVDSDNGIISFVLSSVRVVSRQKEGSRRLCKTALSVWRLALWDVANVCLSLLGTEWRSRPCKTWQWGVQSKKPGPGQVVSVVWKPSYLKRGIQTLAQGDFNLATWRCNVTTSICSLFVCVFVCLFVCLCVCLKSLTSANPLVCVRLAEAWQKYYF